MSIFIFSLIIFSPMLLVALAAWIDDLAHRK